MAKKLCVDNNASAVSESACSCISEDLKMPQGEICSSNLQAALGPCRKEADKQHLVGDGDEKSVRRECIKLSIMLVFMASASVAVLAPEALPVFLSALHSHFLLLSTKLSVYRLSAFANFHRLSAFADFHGIWKKFQISGSQIHLALAGTVIGLIILALRFVSLFTRRSPVIPNKPSVSAAVEISQDFKAQTPSESGSSDHVSAEKTPCSEKQDPPSSPLEDSPMTWKPISKPEVSLIFEYSPAEMSTSEKKVNHGQYFLTGDETVQRPERRSRRKSMVSTVIQNAVSQEISVGSSPSGNFMADEREASAGEKQSTMPLRRSSRIRNQALSPPSAGQMLISSRG